MSRVMLLGVPAENEDTFKKHCAVMGAVFKEYGALRVVDCWGVEVPDGDVTSFIKVVKAGEGEVVCLGWVEWNSKAERDEGMPKAMQDRRMGMDKMPFDGKRLIFGGFDKFSDQ